MCCPMLRWRLHGIGVDGLHGNRAIVEMTKVLDGGLMLGVVGSRVRPSRIVVLIRVLVVRVVVVVLVVHLQLAHGRRLVARGRKVRSRRSGSVRV